MTTIKRKHYIIKGSLRKLAVEFNAHLRDRENRLREFLKQFGTDGFYGRTEQWDYSIIGVKDVGQPRLGWREVTRLPGYLVPDTRKNQPKAHRLQGRYWEGELQKLGGSGPRELADAIGAETWFIASPVRGQSYMVDMHLAKIGTAYYVLIPDDESIKLAPHKEMTFVEEWKYLKKVDMAKKERAA